MPRPEWSRGLAQPDFHVAVGIDRGDAYPSRSSSCHGLGLCVVVYRLAKRNTRDDLVAAHELHDEGQAISIDAGAGPDLTGNRSCDNGENLVVEAGSEAVIDDSSEICEDEPTE